MWETLHGDGSTRKGRRDRDPDQRGVERADGGVEDDGADEHVAHTADLADGLHTREQSGVGQLWSKGWLSNEGMRVASDTCVHERGLVDA